ncbi:hypothetical protein SELMODRAFT_415370 [Selaginella moellendorffii]|uniref:Legume lectin domain-containing protein n=1 Tax=Selaginella moellendorffii TaxID=88036 RepID=D8RVX0_SELML|nr:lectin [Selaginella moellendorffii]EFJ23849.1 hypothetical protein SELMODRAFT_415370 [Selaginella moellendorffii]|eukprot:XP_002975064.1 lectin [Selaginella moellendorffii]
MAGHGSSSLLVFLLFLLHLLLVSSFRFSFSPPFTENDRILVGGNATKTGSCLRLTSRSRFETGRAIYAERIRLVDSSSNTVSSFSTNFIFRIRQGLISADGLAFFLTSSTEDPRVPPEESSGRQLGLISANRDGYPSNQMVAVEFDTYPNVNETQDQHVGIDINSVRNSYRVANLSSSGLQFTNMTLMSAWIDYSSSSSVLEVRLGYFYEPRPDEPMVSGVVRLNDFLGDRVWVGFSAATGAFADGYEVLAWEFAAGGFNPEISPPLLSPSPSPSPSQSPPSPLPASPDSLEPPSPLSPPPSSPPSPPAPAPTQSSPSTTPSSSQRRKPWPCALMLLFALALV